MDNTIKCDIPKNTNLDSVMSKQNTNGSEAGAKKQKESKKDDSDKEAFQAVEEYPGPVNGSDVANQIYNTLNKYLVLPDHAAEAITLWVLFSYTYDNFDVCPILAITSPEKRCGKTSLLALLTALCQKVLAGSNITPAATFRAIEKWNPTLLVDEADTFLNQKDELRGILNSGHTRPTAFVTRAVAQGKTFDVKRFSTWTPKAIALIGKLTDTLEDRSIRVKMRRKKKNEKRARIRYSQLHDELQTLRMKIAKWAAGFNPDFSFELPDKLDDRAADNWLPLLTIGNDIGWSEQAVSAAVGLSGTPDTQTYRTMLLKDIFKIFDSTGKDKIRSKELLIKLTNDKEKPWAEFSRGNPMTARKLASMLRPFEISSTTIRFASGTAKGYNKKEFDDAFDRYL